MRCPERFCRFFWRNSSQFSETFKGFEAGVADEVHGLEDPGGNLGERERPRPDPLYECASVARDPGVDEEDAEVVGRREGRLAARGRVGEEAAEGAHAVIDA